MAHQLYGENNLRYTETGEEVVGEAMDIVMEYDL